MLLNANNLDNIEYKTKTVSLTKAKGTEILVALLPACLIDEARISEVKDAESEEATSFGMKVIMKCVVDERGNPVFGNEKAFNSLPLAIQSEIMDAVLDYNGLSEAAQEKIEKN